MTTDSEPARLYAKACEAMARLFYEFELGAKPGDYDTDAASISEFLTAFASRLESPAQSGERTLDVPGIGLSPFECAMLLDVHRLWREEKGLTHA